MPARPFDTPEIGSDSPDDQHSVVYVSSRNTLQLPVQQEQEPSRESSREDEEDSSPDEDEEDELMLSKFAASMDKNDDLREAAQTQMLDEKAERKKQGVKEPKPPSQPPLSLAEFNKVHESQKTSRGYARVGEDSVLGRLTRPLSSELPTLTRADFQPWAESLATRLPVAPCTPCAIRGVHCTPSSEYGHCLPCVESRTRCDSKDKKKSAEFATGAQEHPPSDIANLLNQMRELKAQRQRVASASSSAEAEVLELRKASGDVSANLMNWLVKDPSDKYLRSLLGKQSNVDYVKNKLLEAYELKDLGEEASFGDVIGALGVDWFEEREYYDTSKAGGSR